MSEIKCYGLEIIGENIEDFETEMNYITTSFACNNGFVGVHIDKSKPAWKSIALFSSPKARNDCYDRINQHYDQKKPRVALIIVPCYVDSKYIKS